MRCAADLGHFFHNAEEVDPVLHVVGNARSAAADRSPWNVVSTHPCSMKTRAWCPLSNQFHRPPPNSLELVMERPDKVKTLCASRPVVVMCPRNR